MSELCRKKWTLDIHKLVLFFTLKKKDCQEPVCRIFLCLSFNGFQASVQYSLDDEGFQ